MSKSKVKCCPSRCFDVAPKLFKALGDGNRINILSWLASKAKPSNVGEVSTCCDVDLSVVSRHLKIMKEAGVLTSKKQGKEVQYAVNTGELAGMLRSIADYLENCCEPKNTKRRKK